MSCVTPCSLAPCTETTSTFPESKLELMKMPMAAPAAPEEAEGAAAPLAHLGWWGRGGGWEAGG